MTQLTKQFKTRKSGVTLVELMIAMVIFAITAAGVTSTIIQSQRMAYRAVYENAAFNAAQGFLEQMRSMSYAEFENAFATADTLPTVSSSNTSSVIVDDPLTFYTDDDGAYDVSKFDEKIVIVDVNDDRNVTMNMRFYLMLTNLSTGAPMGQTAWNAFEIQLSYDFEVPSTSGTTWISDKLVTVVSEHEI